MTQPLTHSRLLTDIFGGGDGVHSALYFVRKSTEEKLNGKIISSESSSDTDLKITFDIDGEKAVCLCDEEMVRFEFSGNSYDMLFKYRDLKNTLIKEIGERQFITNTGGLNTE